MTQDLGLRGATLQVFALIYSFTRAVGKFSGSRAYIADTVGVTAKTVDRAIGELSTRGLLVRREERLGYATYTYTAVSERIMRATGGSQGTC